MFVLGIRWFWLSDDISHDDPDAQSHFYRCAESQHKYRRKSLTPNLLDAHPLQSFSIISVQGFTIHPLQQC